MRQVEMKRKRKVGGYQDHEVNKRNKVVKVVKRVGKRKGRKETYERTKNRRNGKAEI